MNINTKAIFTFILFVTTATVSAGETGFYAVAGIGSAKAKGDLVSVGLFNILATNNSDSDATYNIGAGYDLNKYISFEVGYLNAGTHLKYHRKFAAPIPPIPIIGCDAPTVTDDKRQNISGWNLGAVLSYPVNNKFNVFAKGGYWSWKIDATANFSSSHPPPCGPLNTGKSKISVSGTDPFIGAGFTYDITNTYSIRADFTRYNITIPSSRNPFNVLTSSRRKSYIDVLGASVLIHF